MILNTSRRLLISVCLLLVCASFAQQLPQAAPPDLFNRQEVMIPMRDGVHLQTAIFTPKNATEKLPILLVRTPYGVPENEHWAHTGNYDELIADGYIFVWQNLRGRFKLMRFSRMFQAELTFPYILFTLADALVNPPPG